MSVIGFQLLMAASLFVGVNWVGSHAEPFGYRSLSLFDRVEEAPAFNLLFRLAAPQVFLVIITAILAAVGAFQFAADIWRVTAFYFLIRMGFNIVMGRGGLVSWPLQLFLAGAATGISYWLSTAVLTTPERALPAPSDLTTEMWLLVILFIYQLLNRVTVARPDQSRRQERYLAKRFETFRRRYGDIIAEEASDHVIQVLAYAVLVIEGFNRPWLYQMVERHALFRLGLARTIGPMQVSTPHLVSQEESVRLGVRRLMALYPEARAHLEASHPSLALEVEEHGQFVRSMISREVAVRYNPSATYAYEVMSVYETIERRFLPLPNRAAGC